MIFMQGVAICWYIYFFIFDIFHFFDGLIADDIIVLFGIVNVIHLLHIILIKV